MCSVAWLKYVAGMHVCDVIWYAGVEGELWLYDVGGDVGRKAPTSHAYVQGE